MDGEVVALEKVGEDAVEDGIADAEAAAAADGVIGIVGEEFVGEETAVEEGQVMTVRMSLRKMTGNFFPVRPFGADAGKDGNEAVPVEADAVRLGFVAAAEGGGEVVALAVESALSLKEVEEEEAVENGLRLRPGDGIFDAVVVFDFLREGGAGFGEVGEKFLVQLLDGEGIGEFLEREVGPAISEDGEALGGGAAAFAGAEDVGEAAGGGFLGDNLEVGREDALAGGEGEAVTAAVGLP